MQTGGLRVMCLCRLLHFNEHDMSRIENEKTTVSQMIHLYCRSHHGSRKLCEQCGELLVYALSRLDHCRFGDSKPTCKNCPIHCYKPSMREHMRRVMRYAGPRMLWHHPLAAIRHLSDGLFGTCRRG